MTTDSKLLTVGEWRAGRIFIGDDTPGWVVNAQWNDRDRWNGWLCPALDPHGVEQILSMLHSEGEESEHRWQWAQDRAGSWCLIVVEARWLDEPDATGDNYPAEVIEPDVDGLYRLGNYSWTWSALSDDDPRDANPRDAYVALVRAIGGGFHPDTRGADYTSLPQGYTADDVDRIVEDAAADGLDVDLVALAVLDDGGDDWDNPRAAALREGVALGTFEQHGDACDFANGVSGTCTC